jgi:hypothetical protein
MVAAYPAIRDHSPLQFLVIRTLVQASKLHFSGLFATRENMSL